MGYSLSEKVTLSVKYSFNCAQSSNQSSKNLYSVIVEDKARTAIVSTL